MILLKRHKGLFHVLIKTLFTLSVIKYDKNLWDCVEFFPLFFLSDEAWSLEFDSEVKRLWEEIKTRLVHV